MAGPVGGHNLLYDSTQVYSEGSGLDWTTGARTINITKDTHVSPAFYSWFMNNAKKPLNSYTWDEINEIALAGNGPNYFSIGDTKEVTLNGSVGSGSARSFSNQTYWVYIIGFDHNSAKEGTGIAFQGFKTAQTGGTDIAVAATNYNSTGSGMVMNASQTNSGGWAGSVAYKTIMPQWKAVFPSDLQAVIKSTTLYTDDVGNQSTAASSVKASTNEVYYLAEYEVFGSRTAANTNEAAQQQQYAYYKAGNSKIKYRSDSTSDAAAWWLRSSTSSNSTAFCFVYDTGTANDYYANLSLGAAPAFKVGNPPPLTGEWVFNSTINVKYGTNYYNTLTFTNSGDTYYGFGCKLDDIFGYQGIAYSENTTQEVYDPESGWYNAAYRTINITTPFYRNTNPTFYDWFVANAVQRGGVINLTPQSGVTYTTGLSSVSPDMISYISNCISANTNVTNKTTTVYYDDKDNNHYKISVADQVTIDLNGTDYAFDIIGFKHDNLTDGTGKAGITWQMHDCFATTYTMHSGEAVGWKDCIMRTSTMVTMKNYIPAAWQSIIKPVNKISGYGRNSTNWTEKTSDSCFLISESSIFGSCDYSVPNEQEDQYPYYKIAGAKRKNRNGSISSWWTRSPQYFKSNMYCKVNVYTGGEQDSVSHQTDNLGVAFAFCT